MEKSEMELVKLIVQMELEFVDDAELDVIERAEDNHEALHQLE